MVRFFLLLFIFLLGDVAAEQLKAPGEVNCPALQIGHRVITGSSCTRGPSSPGTVCSFSCHKGYKLSGPPLKHCQIDGSWTDAALFVSCDDVNECDVGNGFCSHLCKNTEGSYHCDCPSPLYLNPADQRTCKARGVQLTCKPNHMEIVLPKNLIHNLEHEHLSLLNPDCRASGNATHYSLSTSVTECGTTSHVYKNYIVYSNRVMESPNDDSDVITHVGKNEIKVPFSCYFNNLEIVHAVGFKPVAQKIHVYVKGRGNYALSLDIFKDKTYGEGGRALAPTSAKYTQADFPISVHLRERVYVQASLDTREKDLKIFASNCCSTPMQDHEATIKFRHPLIVEGCPRDPSVRFHASSDPRKIRFSFEAFQFLGNHDYVFIHCRVHVCDVNDTNSRCAKGCINGNSPVVQDRAKQSKNPVAQPNEEHIKKVMASEKRLKKPIAEKQQEADLKPQKLARGTKTKKLHAAAKTIVGKPVAQPKAKRGKKVMAQKPLPNVKKAQDHVKLSRAAGHRIMKRATERSHKRGVLGSADVSKGPFILEVDSGKEDKREFKPRKVFAHPKRNGINRDVKNKNGKRLSVAPSASNVLLVAMTVASIMALVGVAYLGRKAMKATNNPYNYEPLVVN